ncbi:MULTISPECIES: tetraacyldisaccharide 4'-kinase [Parabacteroides]|uniref:Tetraacyldisaccharide 4'-kinase n=1 Tax=Parabacteroides chinchillae TaxID=871327 RepID=A0A8G2BVG8_9BACT|nr:MULTISPECIES: tetraacyldisaccharide 4'-kinase [Parabacteroides]SEF64950.1 lipid-A-disaccharide kinase [Parabacteroides chinchillae]
MPTDNAIKLNHLLSPFAFLYGLGVRLRNQLFSWGLLPSEQYPIPVICVGNLSAGGTGKTPHTEYLVQLLSNQYKVAVLSRGYKRKTSGYILARPESTSAEIGDEPYQIKTKFPNILVAVDSNRRRGIQNLLALPEVGRPNVIILDDAFQHRYISPSLSIVLTDYNRLYYYDKLLPVGRLREPITSIRRADVVIVTKCNEGLKPIEFRIIEEDMKLMAHQWLFFTGIHYADIKPVFPSEAMPKTKDSIQKEDEILLLAGIASPVHFIKEAEKYSDKVTALTFADHHSFRKKDIKRIKAAFDKMTSAGKFILVTEKDAARLQNNPHLPEEWKKVLYCLPITIDFCTNKQDVFNEMIKKHIITVQRNSILR